MAISTLGVTLKIGESKELLEKIVDIKDFPDLIGDPNMLETTTLSDAQVTNIPGIKGSDMLTFTYNFTKEDINHCDELWENGVQVDTPFDGLMSFGDATELWGLNESTLRKAISYGKLVNGVDVCKFGKQWVVSVEAMKREYGNAGDRV